MDRTDTKATAAKSLGGHSSAGAKLDTWRRTRNRTRTNASEPSTDTIAPDSRTKKKRKKKESASPSRNQRHQATKKPEQRKRTRIYTDGLFDWKPQLTQVYIALRAPCYYRTRQRCVSSANGKEARTSVTCLPR